MSKLTFNTLMIFSSVEKKGKKISFSDTSNIITSSPVDGTKRGKSIIMKSLYHTLGADCFFDALWDDKDKIYILEFTVDTNKYYMYRCNRLFKLFDKNKTLLFKTIDRNELGEKLKPIFKFAVQLPKRDIDKLEVTPPVYNYILNFIDQDRIMGTTFASFENLGQYVDYKENVLYYHFGAFDERYYEIEHELEKVHERISCNEKKQEISIGMYEKVSQNINEVSYSQSLELLRKDVERTKDKYITISNSLSKIRKNLILLRNERAEIFEQIRELELTEKDNERQIKKLNNHICPLCNSTLNETLKLRVSKYNFSDDIVHLGNSMQVAISELERKIAKQEGEYSKWLSELNAYEDKLSEKHGKINDILVHKGFVEIKDKLIEELYSIKNELEELTQKEKILKKEEQSYVDVKKRINSRYYELMLNDKMAFGLEEIKEKSFEKITGSFKGGGSNKPIATIIWYVNLLKLRSEFNPTAINFPVVFDSPNNAETDIEKKAHLYKYIIDNISKDNQLIISGIGYEDDETYGISYDRVIHLDNEKYKLLCEEDYKDNASLLRELSSK